MLSLYFLLEISALIYAADTAEEIMREWEQKEREISKRFRVTKIEPDSTTDDSLGRLAHQFELKAAKPIFLPEIRI